MPRINNPFAPLTGAIEAIRAANVNILPAMGGAVEEMQQPDVEEREEIEAAKLGERSNKIDDFAELTPPSASTQYRSTPPLSRREKHLFRFFIDGSLKTYFLMTGIEDDRAFPVELAQIGAAVMERDDRGRIRARKPGRRALLLIPKGGSEGLSDTAWAAVERACKGTEDMFELINTLASGEGRRSAAKDLRDVAGGKARNEMHKMELNLIHDTDVARNDDAWLILDGGVQLNEFMNHPYMIGVAKSFSKDLVFPGSKRGRYIDLSTLLSKLPAEHRTPAFLISTERFKGRVAVWYVRLRGLRALNYPLMGVVKVELPLLGNPPSKVPTDMVDLLSRCLVAERSVTPYGLDDRWHCHLYPIFQAEQYIKNSFVTADIVRAAMPWRALRTAGAFAGDP